VQKLAADFKIRTEASRKEKLAKSLANAQKEAKRTEMTDDVVAAAVNILREYRPELLTEPTAEKEGF